MSEVLEVAQRLEEGTVKLAAKIDLTGRPVFELEPHRVVVEITPQQ